MAGFIQPTEIELEPSYYFAPGFYKTFWINQIEKRFPDDVINKHVKLKPYREVWLGAIIAAAQTKASGIQHFVGLPEKEPPDILVVRFVPVTTKQGHEGTMIDRIPIEITRCNMDAGESLFKQIMKKNKAAYEDNILAVYLTGLGQQFSLGPTHKKLLAEKKIHPAEVLIVGEVQQAGSIALTPRTFAQFKIYPDTGGDIVNVQDTKSFFSHPAVMTTRRRGVSRKLKPLGKLKLKPPTF